MLHVFGDSHSVIWGGFLPEGRPVASQFPQIAIHHLGASLAYNLMGEDNQPGKWGSQILTLLKEEPQCSAVMLCFGEIDCRSHILKHAITRHSSIEEASKTVSDRYMSFVALLRKVTSVPIFVWGVVASARDFCDWDPSYPYIGSQIERNTATIVFNRQIANQMAKIENVYYFDIFSQLTTAGFLTKESFFPDRRHLGSEGLGLAIEEFRQLIKKHALSLPDYFATPLRYDQPPQPKDIAVSARIIHMSSSVVGMPPRIDKPMPGVGFCFHSQEEESPFVLLDLGYSAIVRRLQIYNRLDGNHERARSLEILMGDTPDTPHMVYRHDGSVFGHDGKPLDIAINGAPPLRYVALRLREKQAFHLAKIGIFVESFI